MTATVYAPDEGLKLSLLWANLVHYANFKHGVHPEPNYDWTITQTADPEVFRVRPHHREQE